MPEQCAFLEIDLLRDIHTDVPDPGPEVFDDARASLRAVIAAESLTPPEPATKLYGAAYARRPRRRFALGVAAAAAVASVAFVVGLTGLAGTSVDVVARAQAALTEGGPVVHLITSGGQIGADGAVVTDGYVGPGDRAGRLSPRIESWATEKPLRFLTEQDLIAPDGTVLGTRQNGFAADGSGWETTPAGRVIAETPERMRATAIGGVKARAADVNNGLGVDPTRQVREMLDAGLFRAAGKTEVRGVAARLLIAEQPAAGDSLTRTEYVVDADTYAPLEIRTFAVGGSTDRTTTTPAPSTQGNTSARSRNPVLISRVVIDRYERLPLNDRTSRLFEVPENPDAGSAAHAPNP